VATEGDPETPNCPSKHWREASVTNNELLSRRFQVLASTADRHFIELVALHTRTGEELTRHFDYTVGRIQLQEETSVS
jgi:hypothetical protein